MICVNGFYLQKGQSKMDNPKKPATYSTQDEYKTKCVGHHYTQTHITYISPPTNSWE